MRFLGYTLANEAEHADRAAPARAVRGDGQIRGGGGEGRRRSSPPAASPRPSEGAKIILKDGEFTVVDGPFTEAKELVGGWALMECRDLDEAVEWTKRFLSVLGDGECRVRPVT